MTTLLIILLLILMAFVAIWSWAMCRAAARADADWEQFMAGGRSLVPLQSLPEVPSREPEESCPNT